VVWLVADAGVACVVLLMMFGVRCRQVLLCTAPLTNWDWCDVIDDRIPSLWTSLLSPCLSYSRYLSFSFVFASCRRWMSEHHRQTLYK